MLPPTRPPTREYVSPTMDSRRWAGFEARAGDIIIGTFSKCGTTWTQRIVDLLLRQSTEPRPVTATAPWLDATFFAPVEQDLATLAAQTGRRFIKTHLPFDALPIWDAVSYIHVARDGRDACLSMHNHQIGYRPEMRARMAAVAQANGQPPPLALDPPADPRDFYRRWIGLAEAYEPGGPNADLPFFQFENTYWRERARPNVLFVHYNDLKADLAHEMRRIADFLETETPQPLLAHLAEAATFASMKRDGATLMAGLDQAFDRGADRFLNRGENGRWREMLSEADIARYEALANRHWSPAQAAWIAQGRLAAGDPKAPADG